MFAKYLLRTITSVVRRRADSPRVIRAMPELLDGYAFARGYADGGGSADGADDGTGTNPLRAYFEQHREGRGIWKWLHYFDVYHRHLKRFVGRPVNVMEVGIYSGGSLDMWRSYFGKGAHIYGVDIEEACRCYETEDVSILIGDQADRGFWKETREKVPELDVLIDDGGHTPEQQIVTLQEVLPHLRPGGVFICEDVQGIHNRFAAFVAGLAENLHAAETLEDASVAPTGLQRSVLSVHQYPFIVVIEKSARPVEKFVAPKHGTEWQPFKF